MKSAGGPPPGMGFSMPMMKGWVPRRIQPWLYVLTAFCFQFGGGIYLGALDGIRGTTDFMIEDVLFLLYATLAGMAVYFPMLFRMKFRFTNKQLLCGSAIVLAVCNVLTMHCQSMPVLMIVCFIAGMAKIQGTFECMSNIQLWITPRRDFAVFFPVLHIILLTQAIFCRPFCPMPQRLSLKGIDFQGALLICGLMLVVSYIVVYGDYFMWFDTLRIRLLFGAAIVLSGIVLYRLRYYRYPYIELGLFTRRNVVPILLVTFFAELAFGAEHTMEEILYSEVIRLEELTKESQYMWALPGMYLGILLDLYWLKVKKWKVWKLFGIAFIGIALYGMLMYFTLDINVNIEQYRFAIFLRGFAYAILAPTLMWALDESVPSLEQFFMGLFVFNILHMYLAGAAGYGIYTTIFSHFMNDNMMSYGQQLTLTHLDMAHFNLGEYVGRDFLHSMMMVAMKQVYGYVIWFALGLAALFLLCDIPAVRTNIRKVPRWPVYAIEYLARRK